MMQRNSPTPDKTGQNRTSALLERLFAPLRKAGQNRTKPDIASSPKLPEGVRFSNTGQPTWHPALGSSAATGVKTGQNRTSVTAGTVSGRSVSQYPTPNTQHLLLACFAGLLLLAVAAAAEPSRPPNRLAKETSPYLLQHAHNPVDWYPWGPEAFEKAKKENKPIFLSVGYSSCHWCHVMERESFEDEGIARQLNERFVSVKVDREERPDIDETFMIVVQAVNEGRGGWPMSVFLTPEGRPFFGGTYYKREAFAELLRSVHEAWADAGKRKQLEEQSNRLSLLVGGLSLEPRIGAAVTPATLTAAGRTLLEGLDETNGGFGNAPKFPPAVRLQVLLAEHRKQANPKALKAVNLTLDRMARGGLYDQVGGGFHRYTVDAKWLVPHFEKMLYDNALLASTYLEGHRVTGSPEYRRVAVETLDFVLRELRDPAGGFWSALDADSPNAKGEREEGLFYVWTPAQVTAALGAEDGALFNRVYGITPAGNWEGKSIPNLLSKPLEAHAKELKTTPQALRTRLDGLRRKLLAERGKRTRPHLDDKVLANWNGLMIQALALGYDVTGDTRYREAAEQAASFILKSMRKDGKLLHSYRAGRTQPQSFLEDYAFVLHGLLELHRVTGQETWLREAESLGRVMVADFWDEGTGAFYSTPHHGEVVLARLKSAEDNATPSGISMAALGLVRLSRLTGDAGLRAKAQQLLESYGTDMKRFPQAIAGLVLAAHVFLSPEAPAQAQRKDPVKAVLEGVPAAVKPGDTFEVRVRLTIAPKFHINADKPADEFLIPTKVEPAGGPFTLVSAIYPTPKVLKLASISEKPAKVYEGDVTVTLKLKADAGAEKATELRVKVHYQACDDQSCFPPKDLVVTGRIGK